MWKSCNFRITKDYEFDSTTKTGYNYKEVPCNKCALKCGYNQCDMDDCILISILKFVVPVVDDTIV